MLRAVWASITFNPNPNFKKSTFFLSKVINYHQKFKFDLPYLARVNYNLILPKIENYFTLPRQDRL